MFQPVNLLHAGFGIAVTVRLLAIVTQITARWAHRQIYVGKAGSILFCTVKRK